MLSFTCSLCNSAVHSHRTMKINRLYIYYSLFILYTLSLYFQTSLSWLSWFVIWSWIWFLKQGFLVRSPSVQRDVCWPIVGSFQTEGQLPWLSEAHRGSDLQSALTHIRSLLSYNCNRDWNKAKSVLFTWRGCQVVLLSSVASLCPCEEFCGDCVSRVCRIL